jgi:hypothetical protein
MEAVRTSETSVDNHFTRQYIPEDNSEHHTRRRENLKSHRSVNHSTTTFGPRKYEILNEEKYKWNWKLARLILYYLADVIKLIRVLLRARDHLGDADITEDSINLNFTAVVMKVWTGFTRW